jgi:hypothetical protein
MYRNCPENPSTGETLETRSFVTVHGGSELLTVFDALDIYGFCELFAPTIGACFVTWGAEMRKERFNVCRK